MSGVSSDYLPRPRSEKVEVDVSDPSQSVIDRAGKVLREGGLVAFPTETVYGLGANALDPSAIEAVFQAKGRPATDPLIVHVGSVEQAELLVSRWTPGAAALAKEFWPGPLTLILPKSPVVSDVITSGRPTVALRLPDHPVARSLIAAAGVPVAAPSANRFGRISPTTAAHVESELAGSYDLLLDAGPTAVGVESSVVDLSGELPVLLRPGGITLEDLRRIVPGIDHKERESNAEEEAAGAPGQFLRHYAPTTPLVLVDDGHGATDRSALVERIRSGLTERNVVVWVLSLPTDGREAAHELYSQLRIADESDATLILASALSETGLGRAVNDRLFRAAHGRIAADSTTETLAELARLAELSAGTQAG